jgi:hypothetical protein
LRKQTDRNPHTPQADRDIRVMLAAVTEYIPIYTIVKYTDGKINPAMLDGLLDMMNGRWLRGAARFAASAVSRSAKTARIREGT